MPLDFGSDLQNSHMIFKVIYSHSHDSITSSTILQLSVILSDYILISALVVH